MKASRVTIDIDSYDEDFELTAVRAYHNLERLTDYDVEVRISSSGEGIHLVGWFSERLSDEEKRAMRRSLSDDARRIELDSLPSWHRSRAVNNVLWSEKGGGSEDEDFDDIHDALDHIRMRSVSASDAVRALANDGRRCHGSCQHWIPVSGR